VRGYVAVVAGTVLALFGARGVDAQPSGGTAGRDLTVDIVQAGTAIPIPTKNNAAFVVTVSNIRSGQASNVLVSVNIPSAFTSLSGTGCTFKGSAGSCTTPTLGGNSQKSFTISGTAPSTITGTSQSFTLTAVADPNNTVAEGDGGNNNNSDNLTVTVVTRADLNVGLSGTAGQSPTLQVAPDLVFVVNVDNDGDQAAPNLLVRSTLPKDVSFVRVEENTLGTCLQNSTASNGGLNVNCTLSSLPVGATRSVRIVGKLVGSVPDGVQVTSAVNVDPSNTVPERNENDNTAFLITTMRAISDVQIVFDGAKVAGSQSPTLLADCGAGSKNTIEATVTVRNNGPFASAPTIVTAQWPAPITSGGTCFDRCDVPALNSGQSVVVKLFGAAFDSKIFGEGKATFTVDPAQTLFDSVVGNNSVTGTVCTG
jgi:hypothetical protein